MRLLTEKDQQDVKADTHNDSLSPQPHLGDLSQLEQAVNYTMNEWIPPAKWFPEFPQITDFRTELNVIGSAVSCFI